MKYEEETYEKNDIFGVRRRARRLIVVGTLALFICLVLWGIFWVRQKETHLYGGGFKDVETSNRFEAGVFEPKPSGEIAEPDIAVKRGKIDPDTFVRQKK